MRHSSQGWWLFQKRSLGWCCRKRDLEAGFRGLEIRRFSHRGGWDDGTGFEGDEVQTFKIQTGSAGSITVDVHNSNLLENATAPLYIYLPPHGNHHQPTYHSLPPFLPQGPKALAKINYRWNHVPRKTPTDTSRFQPSPSPPLLSSDPRYANHPFPTPLHDVLHAFEFLTTSFLQTFSPKIASPPPYTNSPYRPPISKCPQRPLILTGTLHGGTLATSLALTETRTTKSLPYYIAALLVKNGIFNWSTIATSLPPPSPSLPPTNSWNISTLHSAKTQLFAKPEHAFDQFISPILFFRTSGLNVPSKWKTIEDETPSQHTPSNEEYYSYSEEQETITDNFPPEESFNSTQHLTSSFSDILEDLQTSKPLIDTPTPKPPQDPTPPSPDHHPNKPTTPLQQTPPPRKAHLKYPPKSTERQLKIPRSLFLTTPDPNANTTKGYKDEVEVETDVQESITPKSQADELARYMRRSVLRHELEERRMWDEELDVEGESERRVRVLEVGEGEEVREVREWIEESL